jgi:hypothetical protein
MNASMQAWAKRKAPALKQRGNLRRDRAELRYLFRFGLENAHAGSIG